jgi:hypothetical protein
MFSLTRTSSLLALVAATVLLASCNSGSTTASAQKPNILFIVLDDLGVDQLAVFGYGGLTAPATPVLDTLANAGVRFRNTWSMPTCSPSRATFFVGRYPFRTLVENAILGTDLANSQVSPYEYTVPKVLKQKGYINAVVGKMHLSGSDQNPDNNPLGDGVMHQLGWDYFAGYLDGGPFPIDTSAGIDGSQGKYTCGFVPGTHDDSTNGADSGACYSNNGTCQALSGTDGTAPGRMCLEQGGVFDPGQSCKATQPSYIKFNQNAYYTGEWVFNHPDGSVEKWPASDPRNRKYRTTLETDRALAWLKQQNGTQPWMLSVGYSAIHTPLQPPPSALLPAGSVNTNGFDCTTEGNFRVMTNQMIEAMDKEIGRLLVDSGLAGRNADGSLSYDPAASNTVIVVVGDNGTYGPSVKLPFDPTRAKGFPYQTGVWVPLIVTGPMVAQPGREVPHMVNIADLYSLFADLAGVDLTKTVPDTRAVDAQPLLPYLTDPGHSSIRSNNYTEVGTNTRSVDEPLPSPCVVPSSNVCVQMFPSKGVCEDQGGTWYGDGGAAGTPGLASCCAVNQYLVDNGKDPVNLFPETQRAIRNSSFKLVRLQRLDCSTNQLQDTDEFYRIDETSTLPKLDKSGSDLLALSAMTPEAQRNYQQLSQQMDALLDTNVSCQGDGNNDGVVDQRDLEQWGYYSILNGGNSSWYDFNHDGKTDTDDRTIIEQNLGKQCAAG